MLQNLHQNLQSKSKKKTSANTSLTLSPLAITAADEFADKNKSLTNTANKNQDK
jgi:hypothetical protein